jgi:type IV fimbrial biogenesis protein FimT
MPDQNGHQGQAGQAGITLIEQIMALAIVAVLVSIAAPSLGGLVSRNRLQSMQMDYIAGLQHAREAAITHGVPVVFCPSSDGVACQATSVWDQGWLIAEDRDADNQPDHQALYTGTASETQLHVRSSTGRYRVRFHPDGSAAGSNLTFTVCLDGRPGQALNVVVSNAGRVRGDTASAAQSAACAVDG